MRFDKDIELLNIVIQDDGLGGREEKVVTIGNYKAHVKDLSIEATYKIYGQATTDNYKIIILGRIEEKATQIKYNNKLHKIISKRFVKNKTCYYMELINND